MERTASCPSCGRGVFDGDAFCSWCGTPIQARTTDTGKARQTLARKTIPTGERETCASCNSPILPGDVFCSTCGARHGVDPSENAFADAWSTIPRRIAETSRGKYELIRELGRGGMGIVFMARDRELERLVAIKVLSPSLLADEDMVTRFQREARTIASLRHESIISVYDVGRAGDLHYFVMDFIEGVSLSRILRTFGPLPIPVVEAVLYQVGSALSYAHRPGRGIVHRDVKPSNIMLDNEGLAVVMDFGISKVSEAASGLTRTGLVIGTPEYMSPEQCRGHTVTQASDQYSLGTVTFAMLTGAPPFTGPFYRVLMAHQTEPVPSILELRPDCPPELAAATERMLGKAPGDRWPGIRDLLRELGLRPQAHDDPALRQLAGLVADTIARDQAKGARASGDPTAEDTADRRTPSSIRIVPVPGDLEIGDELGLRASALFPDGVEEMGLEVAWESTDPSIVRVDPSTGQLEAIGVGAAEVTAVGAGLSESIAVKVRRPLVVRMEIEPADVEVEEGSTVRLLAQPRNKRDEPLERPVSWSSSDPRTASVSAEGVVTGHRPGSASILAHSEGVGAAAAVRVQPSTQTAEEDPDSHGASRVARLDVSRPPSDLRVSDTFHLRATPLDAGERPVDAEVGWTVEDPAVLEDLGEGRFRAVGPGEGTLLARAGIARLRVPVSVREAREPQPPAPGLRPRAPEGVGASADRQERGASPGRKAREPSPTTAGSDRPFWALWAVLAVVLAAGGVWMGRGLLGGGDAGPVVADVTILDGTDPVTSGLALSVGDSVTLAARLTDAEGEILDRPVTWSSSDPEVASVGGDGLLLALDGGSARVTARSEDVARDVDVRVETPPSAIVVSRAADGQPVTGRLTLDEGQSVDLDAGVTNAAGEPVAGPRVTWSAAPPSVASVDAGGVVSAQRAGQAVVTARAGGLEAEIPVTVRTDEPPPPPAARGTLLVRILPTWANLIVDGVVRSEGAMTHRLSLSVGQHTLRLENPNMAPLDTTFTIRADATTELQLRLRQRNQE